MSFRAAFILFVVAAYSNEATADSLRAQQALDPPDWLSISGETRARYETLDSQFRRDLEGSDQGLLFRTLVKIEADAGGVALGVELQDSRAYLTDEGSPLSTNFVNPVDFLQAYARLNAPGFLGAGSQSIITLGRQTVSIGSKRQIERANFGNVIKSYTGVHGVSTSSSGDELHVLFVVPVGQEPSQRDEIDNNAAEFDREQIGRRIWAVHYRRADAVPGFARDIWAEYFVYGLNESDRERAETPNRRYVTPGFRLYRAPSRGIWDMDFEGAIRFGKRRATRNPGDVADLDVFATQLLARIGYTVDAPWRPRLALQYYWASGDNNPDDGRFGQYERLFGSRSTDLNHTSLYGPLAPANLSAPGIRLEITPSEKWDARLYYSAASLASATDEFVIAKLRDETGLSGRFLGHALDARIRYHAAPNNLVLEAGASALLYGRYVKSVPAGPEGDATLFAYWQATFSF